MYFPQKKNFNAEQSFSTTFFHVQNCLKIVLCHDLCTNILWRSFAWWLGMHKWCFSEPKLCANRDVLIWSLFSHAWLGSLYNTYRCLIAHLRGLLVMHGGNSFNIRGKDVVQRSWCWKSCHHASLVAHAGVQSGICKYCIGSPIMHGWIKII